VLFAAASAAIGMAPNDAFLIAGRAVQGIGAAFMMPGTLSIISNTFPPQERGRAIGTWAGVSALALALGPVVGGALTQYVSWRAIFYINVPVAAAAVAVTLFATRESRDESVDRRIDWPGIATLSIGLTALILALVESTSWGWGDTRTIALLATAAVSLPLFLFLELKVPAPMVQFDFFKSRQFFGANVIAVIVSFAMLGMFLLTALYIQNILGYSPLQAGIRFLPTTLMIVAIAPISGRLADKIGSRIPITVGMSLTALSLFLQTRITVNSGYTDLLPAFVLMGIGMALVMSPMSTAAMNAVPANKAGVASGILSMNRMVGGTFGVALVGTIFQTVSRNKLMDNLSALNLSPGQKTAIADNIGQSAAGAHITNPAIVQASKDAFVHGFTGAMTLSVAVATAGALLGFALIQGVKRVKAAEPAQAQQPETTAEPIGV
jgi:EmrB/QacA subfamily drug resistance transporter